MEHGAFVVVSAPNVTHRDISLKLAIGRWGCAQVGPPGRTATRMFSAELLDSVLRGAGLHTIASNDVRAAVSSQHFPATHPVLARGSQLRAYLTELRDGAEKNGDVCRVLAAGQNVSCLA